MKQTIRLSVTISLLIMTMTVLAGCQTPGKTSNTSTTTTKTTSLTNTTSAEKELAFDLIGIFKNGGGTYTGANADIKAVTDWSPPLPEEISWLTEYDRDLLLSVDYSLYFVVLVFNGFRHAIFSDMRLFKISQKADTVFVISHFNDPPLPGVIVTSLPADSSQYQAVKINRNQLAQTGNLNFRLLDDTGNERAFTSANIRK